MIVLYQGFGLQLDTSTYSSHMHTHTHTQTHTHFCFHQPRSRIDESWQLFTPCHLFFLRISLDRPEGHHPTIKLFFLFWRFLDRQEGASRNHQSSCSHKGSAGEESVSRRDGDEFIQITDFQMSIRSQNHFIHHMDNAI